MTYPEQPGVDTTPTDDTAMTLSAQRLVTGTQWVESGRLTLRKRVVTETRTVEVTLRREELVVDESYPPPGTAPTPAAGADHGAHEPWVIILRQEVPDITIRVEPYERVTVTTEYGTTEQAVAAQLRHEDVDYGVTAATDAPR